jgi:hypothetical protein
MEMIKCQVERYLGDKGKDAQPLQISPDIPCMMEALHNQKYKDRERKSADTPAY